MPNTPPHLQNVTRIVGELRGDDAESNCVFVAAEHEVHRLQLTDETRVYRGSAGRRKDIHTGSRVIVHNHPTRSALALEVLVLPRSSAQGVPVVAAAPDSLTFKGLGGNLTTVNTKRALIQNVSDGDGNDLLEGATVLTRVALGAQDQLPIALEVIVLPDETTYHVKKA